MTVEGSLALEVIVPEISVNKIADKFGFGEGGISHKERKLIVGDEMLAKVESTIMSDNILVPVSTDKQGNLIDDDGCGDGRAVKTVYEGRTVKAKSLNRSKVFGGGVAMTAAMKIGIEGANNRDLQTLFHDSIEDLKDKQIGFGAHTDDRNSGSDSPNSGCGAIDLAPHAIHNAVKFRENITETIAALGVDTSRLGSVFKNFSAYSDKVADQPYSGKKVVDEVSDNGKIVKELQHNHHEMYVVLNTISGKTVNQELIRSVSEGEVQVFGVDVWRMQELAVRKCPGDKTKQDEAFLSELVYTLGVSATLTKGDLPVYVITEKAEI